MIERTLMGIRDATVRMAAREVVRDYRVIVNSAAQEERTFRRKALENYGVDSPEALGTLLFVARTGKNPIGPVALSRKEGYFLLACPNPTDYNIFLDPYLDRRAPDEFRQQVEVFLEHGGTFHESLALYPEFDKDGLGNAGAMFSSVIVAKTTEGAYGFESIFDHERQHFINHRLLRLFDRTEKEFKGKKETPLDAANRAVKDEIVSFVRGRSHGSQITQSLSGAPYAHLFKQLNANDSASMKSTIQSIGSALDTFSVFYEPESRKALAMQLMDIPLQRIPEAIPRIAEFYQKRLDRLTMNSLPEDTILDGTTSPSFASERSRLRASVAAYQRGHNEAIHLAFTAGLPEFEATIPHLVVRRAAVERDLGMLRTGGIVIPSGSMSLVGERGTQGHPTDRLAAIAKDSLQEILSRLTRLSNSERTAFARAAWSGAEPAFSDALKRGVEDPISRPLLENGSGQVEISYFKGSHTPNDLRTTLTVTTTFPDRDPSHKVVYQIVIHGKPEEFEPVPPL